MTILTTKQVAQKLCISVVQVLNYCHRQDNPIPHIKLSTRVFRFREDLIDEWLAKCEVKENDNHIKEMVMDPSVLTYREI